LSRLGDSWLVTDELIDELDSFTCALCGQGRSNSVDSARHTKINALCHGHKIVPSRNVDMGTIPPCMRSLVQHVKRVNHQVGVWKRALIPSPDVPDPDGNGWTKVDGKLEPHWYDGMMLPERLVDVAEDTTTGGDAADSDETDSDSDMDEMFSETEENINMASSSDDD
jgi:hypothetical protein